MPITFIPLPTRHSARHLPLLQLAPVIKATLSAQRSSMMMCLICVIIRERTVELKLQNVSAF